MVAANYSTVRNNLKEYCDMATDQDEIVVVTRKMDKNVVILSLDRFTLMEKMLRNYEYMERIKRGFDQLSAGEGTIHELTEE